MGVQYLIKRGNYIKHASQLSKEDEQNIDKPYQNNFYHGKDKIKTEFGDPMAKLNSLNNTLASVGLLKE